MTFTTAKCGHNLPQTSLLLGKVIPTSNPKKNGFTVKEKVGITIVKVEALPINLNIDGSPITSRTHIHPSHSPTDISVSPCNNRSTFPTPLPLPEHILHSLYPFYDLSRPLLGTSNEDISMISIHFH
jgi:hypothetical protein